MADAKTEKQKESTVSREETVSKPVIHKNSQTVSAENAAAKGSEQQLLSGNTDKKAVTLEQQAVDSKKETKDPDERTRESDRRTEVSDRVYITTNFLRIPLFEIFLKQRFFIHKKSNKFPPTHLQIKNIKKNNFFCWEILEYIL